MNEDAPLWYGELTTKMHAFGKACLEAKTNYILLVVLCHCDGPP